MLEPFGLLRAVGGVRGENVLKAQRFLGYEEENATPRRIRRNVWSTMLIAAVLVSLFTITAYALGLFRVEPIELTKENAEDQMWLFTDSEGKEMRWGDHCEHGFCFYFGGEEAPHKAEFRPGWRPQDPTFWIPGTDISKGSPVWDPGNVGWMEYLLDERQRETDFFPEPGIHDVGIPYLVTINYAFKDHYLVFNGACEIVKHETWDRFEVYELTCEKEIHLRPGVTDREDVISRENYVLLFSLDEGYMINVGGTSDLETLEHIARELEIRTTDEPLQFTPDSMVQQINIALG